MLRLAVLLLLLANGAYFAWAHGILRPVGLAPIQQSEPQRLSQQIRPESLRVLAADEARKLDDAARPSECLQASPIDEAAVEPLRQALAGWPTGSWSIEPTSDPGRWIVYMGKYPSADNVAKKKSELRQIGVVFEPVSNPELEPGLSLGGYPSQFEANQLLERLALRGVHTARVVQERPDVKGQKLTLPSVDEVLRTRLDDLRPVLAGKPLRPCR
ncbi:MAG: hypothetical protein NVS2B4_02540 [Ramlibacter sp.]